MSHIFYLLKGIIGFHSIPWSWTFYWCPSFLARAINWRSGSQRLPSSLASQDDLSLPLGVEMLKIGRSCPCCHMATNRADYSSPQCRCAKTGGHPSLAASSSVTELVEAIFAASKLILRWFRRTWSLPQPGPRQG